MSKVLFSDNSYIECKKIKDDKIVLIISATDHNNPLKKIINTIELTIDEFKKLISDI